MRGVVVLALYLLGMAVGVLYALALKRFKFTGEPVPFVMELPNYRLPSAKSVLRLVWDKAKGFIQKAFTVVVPRDARHLVLADLRRGARSCGKR